QTVVQRQLSRGLPGILPIQSPLIFAHPRIRRRQLADRVGIAQQETRELETHELALKTRRYRVGLRRARSGEREQRPGWRSRYIALEPGFTAPLVVMVAANPGHVRVVRRPLGVRVRVRLRVTHLLHATQAGGHRSRNDT